MGVVLAAWVAYVRHEGRHPALIALPPARARLFRSGLDSGGLGAIYASDPAYRLDLRAQADTLLRQPGRAREWDEVVGSALVGARVYGRTEERDDGVVMHSAGSNRLCFVGGLPAPGRGRYRIAWSPDGRDLAVLAGPHSAQTDGGLAPEGIGILGVVAADKPLWRQLARVGPLRTRQVGMRWTPSGLLVWCVGWRADQDAFWVVTPPFEAGKVVVRRLALVRGRLVMDCFPSPSGRLVALHMYPRGPGTVAPVWLLNTGSGDLRQLTTTHRSQGTHFPLRWVSDRVLTVAAMSEGGREAWHVGWPESAF